MDSSSSVPEATESFSQSWLSSENSTTSNETPTRLDNPLNDSFHFEINPGGVTGRRSCYAEELFSNGLIRRSFPDDDYVDYYLSPAAALKQPVSLDHACVCPAPPVLPAPPSNERRRHHRPITCCRKTMLGQFCWSVRKCFLMPFHCGIISRVDDIDTRSAVKASTGPAVCHGGGPGAVSPARCSSSKEKWIEFENPIYEAVLHCKRSCSLDASNNR